MKPNKHKKKVYRLGLFDNSTAIEVQNEAIQNKPFRVSTKTEIVKYKRLADSAPNPNYKSQLLAYAHQLCENVSDNVVGQLKSLNTPAVCDKGCAACCYYTDMDATGLEFEEILHYISNKMSEDDLLTLQSQLQNAKVYKKFGFTACPFLNVAEQRCTVYPVRPSGCRGLFATKTCALDVEEDTGLTQCVALAQKEWTKMPIKSGHIMAAVEHKRKKKGHLDLNNLSTEVLVLFKKLEKDKLLKLVEEALL